MAAASRTENPDLALEKVHRLLFAEPCSFDFFQAVRVLGWLQPGRSPVGRYSHPDTEIVRFGSHPTLNFPASAVHTLTPRGEANPFMNVNFMGLVGPLGVLPNYVTELIASRLRAQDRGMLEFLNIFNHRLISFFYQAWEKNHFTVAYERDGSDSLTACLFALVGLGTPGLRHRHSPSRNTEGPYASLGEEGRSAGGVMPPCQGLRDETFIYYSGLFALMPKSALALESIVGDYFGIPVEVEPFVGTWRTLHQPDYCVLGDNISEACMLGWGAVAGDEIWDQQSRVRLKLGPLTAAQYRDFLPSGAAWPELKAMLRGFYGRDLEFEVQLILRREDVPAPELRNPGQGALCLGWDTWLKSRPEFGRDPGDTILLVGED